MTSSTRPTYTVIPEEYLVLEQSFGPHDLVEDVFAHVGVHGAQRVVEEEDVVVAVDRPRQTDPLLLTPAQVDALDTEQRAPTSTTQLQLTPTQVDALDTDRTDYRAPTSTTTTTQLQLPPTQVDALDTEQRAPTSTTQLQLTPHSG